MNRYAVKAVTSTGEVRNVVKDAESANDIALALLAEGLTPVAIRPVGKTLFEVLGRPIRIDRGPRSGDLALFCEQLAAMTTSGLTLEHSLKVLTRQAARRPSTQLAQRLLPRIQGGMSLSNALEAESAVPTYLSGMVRAAEHGGHLGEGLVEAGRYLERQSATRGKLISTLTYPAVVLLTVFAALVLVLTVVVPSFAPMFSGEEHRLPRVTRVVLWVSEVFIDHLPILLLSALAAVLALVSFAWRFPALGRRISRMANVLPPVRFIRQLDAARVIGVMGMLFRSGMEVSEAVSKAARSARSDVLRTNLESTSRRLREGESISRALGTVDAVPDDTRALIAVGEQTGELALISSRAAQLLERAASHGLDKWVSIASPLAIMVLGVLVGTVVAGVMLGVLSLNQLALKP